MPPQKSYEKRKKKRFWAFEKLRDRRSHLQLACYIWQEKLPYRMKHYFYMSHNVLFLFVDGADQVPNSANACAPFIIEIWQTMLDNWITHLQAAVPIKLRLTGPLKKLPSNSPPGSWATSKAVLVTMSWVVRPANHYFPPPLRQLQIWKKIWKRIWNKSWKKTENKS